MLVATDRVALEHYARGQEGAWVYRRFGPGETLVIDALGIRLEVDALYADLPEEPAPEG